MLHNAQTIASIVYIKYKLTPCGFNYGLIIRTIINWKLKYYTFFVNNLFFIINYCFTNRFIGKQELKSNV